MGAVMIRRIPGSEPQAWHHAGVTQRPPDSSRIACLLMIIVTGCGGAARGSDPAEFTVQASPSTAGPTVGGLSVRALGNVGGAPLGYLEYLPPGYGDGKPRPLLVFLHGSGEAGNGSEAALDVVDKLGPPELIEAGDWPDDRPFVVLAPQYGTGPPTMTARSGRTSPASSTSRWTTTRSIPPACT